MLSAVENFGLQTSTPTNLHVVKYSEQKREVVKELQIPSLKPYEEFSIEVPVIETGNAEYDLVFVDTQKATNFWNKVDETHYTVVYNGSWNTNKQGENIYLGTEKVAKEKGASVTFFFSGTQAQCFGNISKEMGSCDVFIDDTYIETVDCFFGADIHNTVIYQTPILPKGLHKLELRVTGKQYKEQEEGPVAIDAFSYR